MMIITATVSAGFAGAKEDEVVLETVLDDAGRVLVESGLSLTRLGLGFERTYTYRDIVPVQQDVPPGGGADPGTDCESDAYKKARYAWNAPYSAFATNYAATFNAAGETWDAQTGANIFGNIQSGNNGVAGQLDDVNQIAFANLGGGGTIAVTTTWYQIANNVAVESDGQYNTFYSWNTNGAANDMDVENIGAHEIGHTWGLNHPNGGANAIGCLTMYAYADFGETQKRTLGDGDILGIKNKYGN